MQQNVKELPRLSQAFLRQRPLYVNLLDDLGSSDFFVIEADSLVLDCLSSSRIEHQHGGQMLHACYLVESFLQRLQECLNSSFRIVFFKEQQSLWQSSYPFMRLLHQVLKQHLHQTLKIPVQNFDGCTSQDWIQFVQQASGPSVMAHA